MNIQQLLDDYAQFHQNTHNKLTHIVGIPLILFSIILWLSWPIIGIPEVFVIPFAIPVCLALMLYYAQHSWKSAVLSSAYIIPMLLVAYLLHRISAIHPLWIAACCFVIGWILQFIGHIFEKQKPAFSKNLMHLLIGPLFIMLEVQRRYGRSNHIK